MSLMRNMKMSFIKSPQMVTFVFLHLATTQTMAFTQT